MNFDIGAIPFRGWVPTTSGHLSFSSVGESSYPDRAIVANRSDRRTRYVVCYQKRRLLDSPLSSSRAIGLKGRFWFVCVGQTHQYELDKLGRLQGGLFMFKDRKIWRHSVLPRVSAVLERLRIYETHSNGSLPDYCGQEFGELISFLSEKSDARFGFDLLRNGITSVLFKASDYKIGPQPAGKRPGFEGIRPMEEEVQTLASQAFFFLKDMCHVHKHHNPSSDTLMDLHLADNDERWRRETLYALYRKVTGTRRVKRGGRDAVTESQNALGLIAYGQSFYSICKTSREFEKLPDYQADHIKDSILAMIGAKEAILQQADRSHDRLISYVVGTVGVMLSVTALLGLTTIPLPQLHPDKILIALPYFLLERPLYAIPLIGAVAAINLMAVEFRLMDWAERLIRNLIRLMLPMKRRWQISIWVLLTIAAVGFGVWLSIGALRH